LVAAKALADNLCDQRTESATDERHIAAGIDWLAQSQDATDCGGSAAYYSLLAGWAGPYPETTGYIIPTLYDYADYAGEDTPRRRAQEMAAWLLTVQMDFGAFPGGVDPGSDPNPSVFNTGQILFGLVRAYRETGESRYLDAAERASAWLCEVQHAEGYWDRFDYRGEIHSYCSRVAWALLEADAVLDGNPFRESARNHLEWVRSIQTDNGWFEYAAFSPNEVPYLHTIAYTVRGLLEGGLALDNDSLVSAARVTADRLLTLAADGPLAGAYDRSWSGRDFYCLTGNAQTAAVWLRLYEHTNDERYLTAATEELEFLKTHHRLSGPEELQGGLAGSQPVWGPYMRLRYPNWATKFFCEALLLRIQLTDSV
jgi:hypothetical protein